MVTRRAELGQWNTAAPVARLAIAALGGISRHARVIDPTCGDGAFLAAALAAGARHLVGVEIDPDAAALARVRLGTRDIVEGRVVDRDGRVVEGRVVEHDIDARVVDGRGGDGRVVDRDIEARVEIVESDVLAPRLIDRLGLFDIAIGNPPYVRAGRVDPAIKRERARVLAADWPELDPGLIDSLARHADFAATCLLRTLRFVRPGGQIALVVSTALLDADAASALWTAVARVATVEALIAAPGERWFADAAVNPMLLVARRRVADPSPSPAISADSSTTVDAASAPRILRLTMPTRDVASRATSLDDIAHESEVRTGSDSAAWSSTLRAPSVWFAWREKAQAHLVPLRELCDVRRGLTTGANDVFYVRRDEAKRLRLEPRFLAPVVRSPFNGAPAPIAIAPDESPLVAIAVPADAKLAKSPRIQAWFERHRVAAMQTSAARRDPWWSLPTHPARLFFAKAYGPRFVQRLADLPMLADQRVYALHPRAGVDLVALAAVLNAVSTALALESLGRGSMGYGAVEWTVHDALELPVLDVRRADARAIAELHAALAAIARRPVAHVRLERDDESRRRLDRAVLALAPGGEMIEAMWDGLCASVAQRDRYLLPAV